MELNRKRISFEQKFKIILSEHQENRILISELVRLKGIYPITIYKWKGYMRNKPKYDSNIDKLLQ